MTQTATTNTLLEVPAASDEPLKYLIEQVARKENVSPIKQMREANALRRAPCKLTPAEYYEFQIYRASLSKDEKREFVGGRGSFELNLKLSPPNVTHLRGFLGDKVMLTSLLGHLGLPTTQTQAVVADSRSFGNIDTLRSADDIVTFLTSRARYPLFSKPVQGFQALGSAGISGVGAAAGTLQLTSGEHVDLRQFADEIMQKYASGYVFQTAVDQHPELKALCGDAVSTVRVVTIVEDETPRVLYTLWKLPPRGAMSDNVRQDGIMFALLDPATGAVQRCRRGIGPASEWIESHPDTGQPMTELQLPLWQSVIDLAVAAHGLFPVNGILGWDIAIGPEGALVIECNENTSHVLYQRASGRGVLNPDFMPAFARVIARNERMVAAHQAKEKAHA